MTPRITGESTVKAGSVRDFTRWSGLDLPFGSLLRAVSVNGDFSMDRRRLSWPAVVVTLGSDKLEGTMGVRFDTERPVITGTLAADTLNLSDLFAPFSQARTSSGAWSEESIDLAAGDRQRSRPAPLGRERQPRAGSASTTWRPACWSSRAGSRPPSGARISMTAP